MRGTVAFFKHIGLLDKKGCVVQYVTLGLILHLSVVNGQVTFMALPDTTSIAETATLGSVVYTVAPSGGTAPYACSVTLQTPDNATRWFDFSGVDLETIQALDYETTVQYVLTIECADSVPVTGTSSLTVNIQDVNDETPVIGGPLTVNINEEESIGTPVIGLFNVTDADAGDVITYAFTGSDTSYFQVDSSSGAVTVKTRLDRDAGGSRVEFNQLTLVVTDAAGASTSASLTILLDDINDNSPTFSPSVYYVTVAENTASGVRLVTVTCTDPDQTPGNGDITYVIQSGDDVTPKFSIVGNDLQTSGNSIDYESLSGQSYQYQIVVTGTDGGTVPNTGTATIIIQVTGENDVTPAWGSFTPPYLPDQPYEVVESVNVGTTVVTAAATDTDEGADGTLTYSIVSIVDESGSSQPGVFRMNSVSGTLITDTQLNRDPPSGISNYTVVIRAADGGSPSNSVDRTILITLLDANDNAPEFGQALYDVALNEDQSSSTSVLTLAATDADETSTLTYSIISGNVASKFQIVSDELQIQNVIDVDSPNDDASLYSLVIEVVDGGSPELTGSTTVLVTITPTNDYDPSLATANDTVSVPESTVLGATITSLTATDSDFGTHGTVTYSISSGDTGNNFYLNSDSGVVKLVKEVDFESLAVNPVLLVVVVSDGGGRTDTGTVTVSVTDVNDHSPVCSATSLYVSINENLSTGQDVQTLFCSDQDASDSLSYSISSGNAGSTFSVTSSGVVQLSNAVDYESGTTTYSLTVQVSDGTNTEAVQVSVAVDPINEETPGFTPNEINVTWSEDTPTSTTLTTYTAADTDAGAHGQITYAISSVTQSGSASFQIDSATGKILLAKELDYETLTAGAKYYVLTVTATDGGGLQGSGTVTVSVTDVNDNTPVCNPSLRSVTQAENTNAGALPLTLINNLACTDQDDGALGTLTYGLTQTPSGSDFAVDSSTGEVTLTNALDYEMSESYSLSISVTDGGSPLAKSTTVNVVVSVTNINDGGPVFNGTFTGTLSESAPIGQSVNDVTATDPDSSTSPEGELVYSIISGDGNNDFIIDSTTGRVQVNKALDRETTPSYTLTIQAREQVGTNSASTTLTVSLTDVNDNAPSCPSVVMATSVDETASVNDVILSFACADDDHDPSFGTLTYSITAGDTATFQVVSSNLTLKAPIDYDTGTTSYDLTVTASDGTNTEDIQVTVNINPINEATPSFTNSGSYSVDVSEDKVVGNSVLTVAATDSDSSYTSDGQVQYSFVSPYPKFQIDAGSGLIILQSGLDREAVDFYELLVQATDGSLSATATVAVNVTDVNDNAPVFGSSSYSGTVSEADAAGASVIVTVAAIDLDDPSTTNNGVVTYSLTGGNTGGLFAINAVNGEIKSTSTADYDSLGAPSFSLTVSAADRSGGAGALSSTAVVTILITNVNDNSPVFTQVSYNETLLESISLASLVSQPTASDADSGDDGVIFYTMSSHPKFYLDQSTGHVTLRDSLDYETDTDHVLYVVATDKGSPAQSSTATIYITVDDVNDNTPDCSPLTKAVIFREDTSTTTAIASLTCSDADNGANAALTYSINSVNAVAGNGPFQAMSGSSLVLGSSFDYESSPSYAVVIHVSDGGSPIRSVTAELVVSISDVNEHDPVFNGLPYSKNIPESAAVGDSVFKVTATDSDTGDSLSYSIDPAFPEFIIDPQSGDIRLNSPLDRETTDSYNLTVLAMDSGTVDARRTSSASILISITDANDNSPVFSPGSYSSSVSENTLAGVTILSLTSTDTDSGVNGDITYSINSGNTGNVFRVEKHVPSGECRLIVDDATNLDFDTLTSFSLVIRATDGGGLTTDASVNLQVTGYNEFTPGFTPSSSSTESVAEDSSVNDIVIDLNATDADAGDDGLITYTISPGAFGKFSIDPSTGVVVVSGSLDKETTPSYTLNVLAVDSGTNPSARTATYSLTIDVTDVNDVRPVCSRAMYTATISENTSPLVTVAQVSCSDGDIASPNKDLVYSISGGTGSSLFAIDSSTGEVSTAGGSSFDREVVTSYNISIQVADQGLPSLTSSVDMVIIISDENDNDPQFCCSPYSVSVREDVSIDTSFYQLVASDNDVSLSGTVVYSISSGNTGNKFVIDGSTGDIRNSGALDRETLDAYNLTIVATDLGTPPRTSTSILSIDILDSNDNPPECSASYYYGNIAETAVVSDPVVQVSCTDTDDVPNAVLTYSLLTLSIPFAIDGSTGQVNVSGSLDAEALDVYSLDVMVSDGSLTKNVTVTVNIGDINEHAPAFDPVGPYMETVNENEGMGTVITDLNATDADVSSDANSLTFSITGGNTDNAFQINPSSGLLRISKQLDFEAIPSYVLEVTVADGLGGQFLSSTTSVTVSLSDINDNPPVCNPEVYLYAANETVTGSLLSLACTDADTVSVSLTYTLVSGNTNGDLSLGTNTGELSVVSTLDYENTTFYDVTVEVDDGSLSTTVLVIVTVDPVNEYDPVFSAASYQVTVSEATSPGTSVFRVTATDFDDGDHGSLRYSILSGNSANHFAVEEATGVIKVAGTLNREKTGVYNLTVRVSDSSSGSADSRSADVPLDITIDDVNDNYPVFTPTSYVISVSEIAAAGSALLTITALDDDDGLNSALVYTITAGNSAGLFTLNGRVVEISAGQSLDFETTTFHTLTVEAADQGTPSLKSFASVSIQVLPVNEFIPTFASNASVTVSENTAVGTVILTASAMDNDTDTHGDVVYSIVSGNSPDSPFIINPLTGTVQVWASLDYDTIPQSYTLGILAEDESGNSSGLSSTMTFSVLLTDINDETPTFTQNSYYFTLDENTPGSSSIGTVLAVDSDSGTNGQISYSTITGDVSVFTVNSTTGEISTDTSASIDYEAKAHYSLVIRASDAGSPQLSSQCIVYLTITDLNDNKPVFQPANFTISISEDISTSVSVATVYATDVDSGANAVFTYTIIPSTHFNVHSTNGIVTTSAAFDRETQSSYILTVEARDKGSPAQTGTSTVTVEILDKNDNVPVITGTYDMSVAEDIAQGSVVLTVKASDADEGVNADLLYNISSGNTNNDWKVESEIGIVQVANTLDRETTAVYHLVVVVADKGIPSLSSTVTVSLTITDVNDNTPVFSSSPYSFSIDENVSIGSSVGRLTATDADTGVNSALQYELVYVQTGTLDFAVHLSTGDVTTTGNLDRETTDNFILVCRVTNNGSPQMSSEVQVNINITDLNDHAPLFGQPSYSSSVLENSAVGTSMLTVYATDKDIGVNADITFSFNTSTSEGIRANQLLSVDSSGVISTKGPIDRETDTVLNFILIATDGGTLPHSSSASVAVLISDENDNNPVFTTLFSNLEVAYDGRCSNLIVTASATDADQGSNGLVSYFLVQNANNFLFAVDETNGDVTLKATATVNAKYLIYVMSQDNGATTRTSINNLALRIDTFNPADKAISFTLSASKSYFQTVQQSFVDDLTLVYQATYPSAIVRIWCVEERDGVANDNVLGRRRLLATGDKPVTVHTYVLADNSTNSVGNVDVSKAILSSSEALVAVADSSGSPSSAISGAGWAGYGIVQVTEYQSVVEETPWVQTPVGIAVIVCSVLGFLLLLLLTGCAIYCCCAKRRKRPITPVRPMTTEADIPTEAEKAENGILAKHIQQMSIAGTDDLKKGIRPAVLSLPIPDRIKSVNSSQVLRLDQHVYGQSLLARDFDGMAIDPASGKLYEYNTRTKERRWMSTQDGKAVTANNIYEDERSEYLNYRDDV